MKKIDEKDLIDDLRRVGELISKVPIKEDYIEHGKFNITTYTSRKSWPEWQKLIFGDYKRTNSLRIPKEEIYNDIIRVKNLINKIPNKRDYKEHGKFVFATAVFYNNDSWDELSTELFGEIAEYIPSNAKITNEELIKNLVELTDKLGHIPSTEELKFGKYSSNAYKRAFGGFARALLAANLEPSQVRGLTDEEILEDLIYTYNKLGYTPTIEEYINHSKYKLNCNVFINRFGSWTKALLKADVPIENAYNITKEDVKIALEKWFVKNNRDIKCLEYWSVRKARYRREFPYSTNSVSNKFDNIPWQEIMWECGYTEYKTINQFVSRGHFPGDDGNIYLSSIEKQVGDYLYKLKNILYEYEAYVCNERAWTCDFKIFINGKVIWLEIDGMRNNRKIPYKSGLNEKIEYYKEHNYNYFIISYNNRSVPKTLEKIIYG